MKTPGKTDYRRPHGLLLNKVDGSATAPDSSNPDYWGTGIPGVSSGWQNYAYGYGGWRLFATASRLAGLGSQISILANGGCIYIDLNHLELATPEVLMRPRLSGRLDGDVANCPNRLKLPPTKISFHRIKRIVVVLANNSDRQNNSYGGHLQLSYESNSAWDNMMRHRMMPSLFYLMAYPGFEHRISQVRVRSAVKTVKPLVPFQISQRADFIETLLSEQYDHTIDHLVNTRDEPLCGTEKSARSWK